MPSSDRRSFPAGRGERRGSTLLLFPAAVLVVVALAAIAVDSTIAFLAERELANATAAAASDAAAAAIDDRAFYQGNRLELDYERVEALAHERVTSSLDPARHRRLAVEARARPPEQDGCPWTVEVRASSEVRYLFSSAVPGAPRTVRVEATSTATPRQDADRAVSCGRQ